MGRFSEINEELERLRNSLAQERHDKMMSIRQSSLRHAEMLAATMLAPSFGGIGEDEQTQMVRAWRELTSKIMLDHPRESMPMPTESYSPEIAYAPFKGAVGIKENPLPQASRERHLSALFSDARDVVRELYEARTNISGNVGLEVSIRGDAILRAEQTIRDLAGALGVEL